VRARQKLCGVVLIGFVSDGVVISDVLEHLLDLKLALHEIARILKPGARVVFDTINRTPWSLLSTYPYSPDLSNLFPTPTPSIHSFFLWCRRLGGNQVVGCPGACGLDSGLNLKYFFFKARLHTLIFFLVQYA
jgi:hypothetical protein